MLTIHKLLPLSCILVVAFVPSRCQSQAVAPPTAAQCDSAAALAQSDLRAFFTDSPISSCGLAGAHAIAAALLRMSTEKDEWILGGVSGTSGMRDGAIYNAATALASDSAATPEARFAALQILAQQELGAGAGLMPSSGGSGLSAFADTTVLCTVSPGDTTVVSGDQLPADHVGQTKAITGAIAQNSAVTPALRRVAKCLRNHFVPPLLPPIDLSKIHASFVCSTRFKVVNNTPLTVELGYEIRGVEARKTFMAATGKETSFSTNHRGTVSLYYGDQLIQSLAIGNSKC